MQSSDLRLNTITLTSPSHILTSQTVPERGRNDFLRRGRQKNYKSQRCDVTGNDTGVRSIHSRET